MTWLVDPYAQGATPTQIIELTPGVTVAERAQVQQIYKQFCEAKRLSLAPSIRQWAQLQGGGMVRIDSLFGNDTVRVWSGSRSVARLYHGIVALVGWANGARHRFIESDGSSSFLHSCEQIDGGDEVYNHRYIDHHADPASRTLFPMVVRTNEAAWDLWKRAGFPSYDRDAMRDAIPVLLDATSGGGKYAFVSKDKIYNQSGEETYSMADIPVGAYPTSTLTKLHPCITSDGRYLAFRQKRFASVSETLERYNILFGHQLLSLVGSEFSILGDQTSINFTVPLNQSSESVSSSGAGIDEELSGSVSITWLSILPGNEGGTRNQTGRTDPYLPWVTSGYEWLSSSDTTVTESGGWVSRSDVDRTIEVASNFLPISIHSEMQYCSVINSLNYPVEMLWQGGSKTISIDHSTREGYGITLISKTKRNTEFSISGSPLLTFRIGNDMSVDVFEGQSSGILNGHKHETTTVTSNSYIDTGSNLNDNGGFWLPFPNNSVGSKTTLEFVPGGLDVGGWYAWAQEHAINFYELYEEYTPGSETTTDIIYPSIVGGYLFKSRFIIDCDTRIQFYAALKVTVECSGASWKQEEGAYLGSLVLDANPTYTVTISFEWRHGDTEGNEVMHTSSFSKPATEFEMIVMDNMLLWPSSTVETNPIILRMPPRVSPPYEAYNQFNNIATPQAYNDHLAGSDATQDGESVSTTDFEFSELRDGVVYPHKKKPVGVLYARTFTPAGLGGALWLLETLHVSDKKQGVSTEEADELGPYYYAPGVKAAINKAYHFELTERGLEYWSDDIEPAEGRTLPERTERDIKIFYV